MAKPALRKKKKPAASARGIRLAKVKKPVLRVVRPVARKTVRLLIGTRKGAWILKSDGQRNNWICSKPILFGHDINHFVGDGASNKVLLIGAKTGHLGPTVYRSLDGGKSFQEAKQPPAFKKTAAADAKAVERVFCITPGHKNEPGVWYAGTAPAGLFRSEDNGDTWQPVEGFNSHKMYAKWTEFGSTPDGQFLHSICIDPRDENHMYLGISIGGVFESKDKGETWSPLNKGIAADFLPDPTVEFGHDPHWIALSPKNPDRLYQQNHCGIYRIDRPSNEWVRIGLKMPKAIGDVGFPVITHPNDENTAWVFPMNGTDVWPRTSPQGKPAVFVTENGGKSWSRLDNGFPKDNAWWTVYRQGLTHDRMSQIGLYLGTSSGEVWGSKNSGTNWKCLARHLPKIQSVVAVEG